MKSKLERTINSYYATVYNKTHTTKSKHPSKNETVSAISIRTLNHTWRLQTLSKSGPVVGSLLDIKKNMHQLTGDEKIFCEDQQTSRECRLSEEIDIEQANEIEQIQLQPNEASLREESETSYAKVTDDEEQFNKPDDNSFVGESINTSVNRSGLSRMTIPTCDASFQTEGIIVQPKIRLHRKCTESIKSTCNQVSTACGLSVEMACLAVQTSRKALYKHEYFLNIEEVPNDQRDEDFEPVPKRPKKPLTKEYYNEFAYVLPSARTTADHKHLQASEIECVLELGLTGLPTNNLDTERDFPKFS